MTFYVTSTGNRWQLRKLVNLVTDAKAIKFAASCPLLL
ncbi:unnamed protein product [Musa acuminata subsp. malaccensis]|uniref:(wild Malaysian banana) hypothetical protein n=1 Tax=Musa acuminata subsp. malaccensis TaxID=214687 RepID=A0A804JG16_MUSAM|nr:unnamed protein product [Musa acuminata subsp. malaccensis]